MIIDKNVAAFCLTQTSECCCHDMPGPRKMRESTGSASLASPPTIKKATYAPACLCLKLQRVMRVRAQPQRRGIEPHCLRVGSFFIYRLSFFSGSGFPSGKHFKIRERQLKTYAQSISTLLWNSQKLKRQRLIWVKITHCPLSVLNLSVISLILPQKILYHNTISDTICTCLRFGLMPLIQLIRGCHLKSLL